MKNWKVRLYDGYISSGQAKFKNNDNSELNIQSFPYFVKLIKKYLSRDKSIKIADLGCGHGALLYVLKDLGYKNIVGVDFSKEQVEIAHKLGISEVINKELTIFLLKNEDVEDGQMCIVQKCNSMNHALFVASEWKNGINKVETNDEVHPDDIHFMLYTFTEGQFYSYPMISDKYKGNKIVSIIVTKYDDNEAYYALLPKDF